MKEGLKVRLTCMCVTVYVCALCCVCVHVYVHKFAMIVCSTKAAVRVSDSICVCVELAVFCVRD